MDNLFGLCPIHGNDVWLHALIAIAAAVFGWSAVGATDARHHDTTDTTSGTGTPVMR
jgi:hypothetical protein